MNLDVADYYLFLEDDMRFCNNGFKAIEYMHTHIHIYIHIIIHAYIPYIHIYIPKSIDKVIHIYIHDWYIPTVPALAMLLAVIAPCHCVSQVPAGQGGPLPRELAGRAGFLRHERHFPAVARPGDIRCIPRQTPGQGRSVGSGRGGRSH